MESIKCTQKKNVFARFDEGDDLIVSLKKCAEEHGIKSGWFSLIGGLKEFVYGLHEKTGHRNIHKTSKNCFEIISASGNITQKEGETFIHAHVFVADSETMCGGHLAEGSKVYPFAEVVMQEMDPVIERIHDPKIGLWPVRF